VVEAYSPLTRGEKLKDPRLAKIGGSVKKSPAQVMLRWGVESGLVVLPKSANPGRIAENAGVFDFELDAEAMKELDAMEEGLATGWDPRGQK
jgi:diketogulonate reductase-like aldo/keto reductase